MTTAADYWVRLIAAEQRRKELANVTHEMRAKKQARVASNDEPEPRQPRTFRVIHEEAQAEARAILRGEQQ